MLNRYGGDWRWLRRRQDSVWYPTLRIFNQPDFGDWDSVVRDVAAALAALPDTRHAEGSSTGAHGSSPSR